MEASFAFGAVAFLGMLGLGGGGSGGDLVSFIPTETYFQSRRVPVNIENMEDLAKAEPKDAKEQILQLLALRLLAERPELVKKAKDPAAILRTIEKIARGEIAKDRLGFAQEYATRTALALGGKVEKPKAAMPGDPREDCLGWFPASATLVGFLDHRSAGDPAAYGGKEWRDVLGKFVRPRDWNELFKVAELIGNVRIDRVGFAFAADPKDREKDRIFVRISGKADQKRIVAAIKGLAGGIGGGRGVWKESKDAKGTPITTMVESNVAVAFIGDTDLVIAGSTGGNGNGQEPNPMDAIDQVLAVRAGKQKSLLEGAFKDRLKIGKETIGLLVGDVPEELRRMFGREAPAPKSVRLEALRHKDGLDFRFQADLENADAAKDFAKFVLKARQEGLDGLKMIPAEIPLPANTVAALRKTLESIQIQPKGAGVEGGVFVSTETLLTAPGLFFLGRSAPDLPPPPPLPPKERKREQSRLLLRLMLAGAGS